MPGIEDVNASSGFQIVEVSYDPTKIEAADISSKLETAGYTKEMPTPTETGKPTYSGADGGSKEFFRHTDVFKQTGQSVSFTQNVSYAGQPLWPCPGMGVVKSVEMDE